MIARQFGDSADSINTISHGERGEISWGHSFAKCDAFIILRTSRNVRSGLAASLNRRVKLAEIARAKDSAGRFARPINYM